MIWLGKDLQQRAEFEKNRWLHCLGGLNTTRGRHGRSSPSVYQLASFITRTAAFYPRMAATHQWHDSSLLQVYNWTTQQLLMSRSLVNNNETVVWCLKEIPSVVCRQSLAGKLEWTHKRHDSVFQCRCYSSNDCCRCQEYSWICFWSNEWVVQEEIDYSSVYIHYSVMIMNIYLIHN